MKKRKQFKKFLKEINAYKSYKKNLERSFKKTVKYYGINFLVSSAFTWIDTEQGWTYWHNVYKKWKEELNND